jgi:Ca2+-binding RTX toxin-like protein
MGTRIAMTLLLLCLVAPASASAGRMRVASSGGNPTWFEYTADFGNQNDVTVSQDGSAVVIHDAGETIIANECEQVDEHTARCTPTPGARAYTAVYTYDLDDRVAFVGAAPGLASAGSGNDVLSTDVGGNSLDGGSGADLLTGSPGDDLLIGAQGKDRINAGAGDDYVAGDSHAVYLEWDTDVIDGGPG